MIIVSGVLHLILAASAAELLDEATRHLEAFERSEALAVLERVRTMAPLTHDENVRLYEQLGIAYAYADQQPQAIEAFDMLLALSPGHALRYTLSPKVTFPFEVARRARDRQGQPELRVTWPLGLQVTDPLPITLEVVADPKGFQRRAIVYARRKGEAVFGAHALELRPPGGYERVVLAPSAAAEPQVVELYAVALDTQGNEVLELGSPAKPYEIALSYEAPPAWYQRWWVWTAAGVLAAGATGLAIYFGTRAEPRTFQAEVVVADPLQRRELAPTPK